MPQIVTLSVYLLCWSECEVTSGTLVMAAIVRLFVDSQRLIARSQNRTKCVKYVWLSYPTWPSRWVLCISRQWLRLKGCHVACDEWASGEICSLQHMWVIGSIMWAAASDESLKFCVQGATATDFRELTAREITGFDCIYIYIRDCVQGQRHRLATGYVIDIWDCVQGQRHRLATGYVIDIWDCVQGWRHGLATGYVIDIWDCVQGQRHRLATGYVIDIWNCVQGHRHRLATGYVIDIWDCVQGQRHRLASCHWVCDWYMRLCTGP